MPVKYALIELNVEAEHGVRTTMKVDHDHWMVGYKSKPESERIVWKSKLYRKEKVASMNQSLVERTENQVDNVSVDRLVYMNIG